MKTHSAIDVAHLLRDTAYFPEKQSDEREKSSCQHQGINCRVAETDVAIVIPKARGLDPHLGPVAYP
jgi:hypothetical protein